MLVFGKEPFGVDRGHAAGAGGGDGLAIDRILRVAAGENAGDVCLHRAAFGLYIAYVVHLQPAFEKLGIRPVADGDKNSLYGKEAVFLCLVVVNIDTRDPRVL